MSLPVHYWFYICLYEDSSFQSSPLPPWWEAWYSLFPFSHTHCILHTKNIPCVQEILLRIQSFLWIGRLHVGLRLHTLIYSILQNQIRNYNIIQLSFSCPASPVNFLLTTLLNHRWKVLVVRMCSQSGKKRVRKFTDLLAILPLVVRQIENWSQGHLHKHMYLRECELCMLEIEHFVSYSKEPEGQCSAGCTFIASSVCVWVREAIFLRYLPTVWLDLWVQTWLCYGADCTVYIHCEDCVLAPLCP